MRHTLFISDLHLEPEKSDITECFFNFLQHQAVQADALYILGDFFEVWIGDDENTPFQQSIIAALKQLTDTNLPVYLMRGNRDFLIGEIFTRAAGCHFLPDPTVIKLYNQEILLTHGDALCTSDLKHQHFRKYTQNPRYCRLFLSLPLFIRRAIARFVRNTSQKHTAGTHYSIMDVTQATVEQQMREHNVRQLIHGHTHHPTIHRFTLDGKPACRMVLGDWHTNGSVLKWDENGKVELMKLPYEIPAK